RQVRLEVRRGQPEAESMALPAPDSRPHAGVRFVEQGSRASRLSFRGVHDLLRVHAIGGNGERSPRDLLSLPEARRSEKRAVRAFEIASALAESHSGNHTALVAIDGPGGSGKSFLAGSILEALLALGVPASVVQMDDFFLPPGRRPLGGPSEKP